MFEFFCKKGHHWNIYSVQIRWNVCCKLKNHDWRENNPNQEEILLKTNKTYLFLLCLHNVDKEKSFTLNLGNMNNL